MPFLREVELTANLDSKIVLHTERATSSVTAQNYKYVLRKQQVKHFCVSTTLPRTIAILYCLEEAVSISKDEQGTYSVGKICMK